MREERMSFLTRFIQDAHHEFKTPLSTIILSTEYIDRLMNPASYPELARISEKTQQIRERAWTITGLLEGILQMVMLEQNQSLDISDQVSLKTVIEYVKQELTRAADENQVTLQFNMPDTLPPVQGK